MIICDQFIYTTYSIKNKSGYQIAAKSYGISDVLINELDGYFYPDNIESNNGCTTFLILNDVVVCSSIQTVGIGYDGRENAIYNHSIVLKTADFKLIENDTRVLSKYFLTNYVVPKELGTLIIDNQKLALSSGEITRLPRNVLEFIIDGVISYQKIAISGIPDRNLLPNIFSILPPSLRLRSFSSFVDDPERQIKFDIIQIDLEHEERLDSKYRKINVTNLSPFYVNDADPLFERSVKFIVDMIKKENRNSLQSIHNSYEKMIHDDIKLKFILSVYLEQIKLISDNKLKEKLAIDVLEILDKFNLDIVSEYLPKIEKYIPMREFEHHSQKLEIMHLITKFNDKPINVLTLKNLFYSLTSDTPESRYDLLKELLKKRKNEFIESGSDLLLDSKRAPYGADILRFFVREDILHQCIFTLLNHESSLSEVYKQGLLESLLESCLKFNTGLIFQMLSFPIFDFNDKYDIKHFRKTLDTVFLNMEKYPTASIFTEFVKLTIQKIEISIKQSYHLGSDSTRESMMKQFVKTMKLLIDFYNKFENGQNWNSELKDEIHSQRHKLGLLIKKYAEYDRYVPRRWYDED